MKTADRIRHLLSCVSPGACLRIALVCILALLSMGSMPARPAQAAGVWPSVSTPEAQGIDSNDLISVLDYIQSENLDVHSILVMRHNKLVMEVYYPPFTPLDKQMQFSATKSFTSALFGIAQGEGKIGPVTDPMLKYFQDVPDIQNMSADKQKITLLDLLNMTSGLEMCDNSMMKVDDPIRVSLDKPTHFEPGTPFEYNPCNSILLGAIIEKQTGMRMQEYARQKLFGPLGIIDLYWATYKDGSTQANIGLMVKPRDMLKFGMLYNQDGVWDSQRIIPKAWMDATFTTNDNGYGYQWWQGLDGFGASGYAGQRIFVFPKSDIITIVTGALTDDEANNIAVTPLFAIKSDSPLPPSPASARLVKRIWDIEHPQPQPAPRLSTTAAAVNGKTIRLDGNSIGWQTARLDFMGKVALLTVTTSSRHTNAYFVGLNDLYLPMPRLAATSLAVPEPSQRYDLNPYEFNFLLGVPVNGITWMKGAWTGADTFTLTVQDTIDFDQDTVTFKFAPPAASIDWYSHAEGATQMTFTGKMK